MKRGGPLRRKKRLEPFGKRAKRQAAEGRAMDVPQRDRRCELTDYLAPLKTKWPGFRFHNRFHPQKGVVDRHHVYKQRHHDHDFMVVHAERIAHEFCEKHVAIGWLVGTWALHCSGRLNRETYLVACDLLGCSIVGKLANWLEPSPGEIGEYDGEPMLASYARKLIAAYPGEGR